MLSIRAFRGDLFVGGKRIISRSSVPSGGRTVKTTTKPPTTTTPTKPPTTTTTTTTVTTTSSTSSGEGNITTKITTSTTKTTTSTSIISTPTSGGASILPSSDLTHAYLHAHIQASVSEGAGTTTAVRGGGPKNAEPRFVDWSAAGAGANVGDAVARGRSVYRPLLLTGDDSQMQKHEDQDQDRSSHEATQTQPQTQQNKRAAITMSTGKQFAAAADRPATDPPKISRTGKGDRGIRGRGGAVGGRAVADVAFRPSHFLCFPLVTETSEVQLEKSLARFREMTTAVAGLRPSEVRMREKERERKAVAAGENGAAEEDGVEITDEKISDGNGDADESKLEHQHVQDTKIIPAAAHKPPGTFHLTIGTMDLTDEKELKRCWEVLKSMDLRGMMKEIDGVQEHDEGMEMEKEALTGEEDGDAKAEVKIVVPETMQEEHSLGKVQDGSSLEKQEEESPIISHTTEGTEEDGEGTTNAKTQSNPTTVKSLERPISPPPLSSSRSVCPPITIDLLSLSAFPNPSGANARVFYALPVEQPRQQEQNKEQQQQQLDQPFSAHNYLRELWPGAGSTTIEGPNIGIGTGIDTGISTGIDTGISTGIDTGISTGIDTGISTGISTGIGGSGTGGGRLLALANKIRDVFQREGFVREDRQLILHATVANLKPRRPLRRSFGRGGRGVDYRLVGNKSEGRALVEKFEGSSRGKMPEQQQQQEDQGSDEEEVGTIGRRGYVWAKDIVVDRVRICKMGAEKSDDPALGMVYEPVFVPKFYRGDGDLGENSAMSKRWERAEVKIG